MKVTSLLIFLILSLNVYSYQFSDSEMNSMLQEAANEYSKNLSVALDAGTILTGVVAGMERNLVYKYKLTFTSLNDPTINILIGRVTRKHINNYCTNPKLSFYRKAGVLIDHYFYDSVGKHLFTVRTSTSRC